MNRINEKILFVLYGMNIKPSVFIKEFKKQSGNINKTVECFLSVSGKIEKSLKSSRTGTLLPGMLADILIKLKAQVANITDEFYPWLLKQIYFPPPVIFFKGEKIKNLKNCIAVVGTRNNTAYGRDAASYLSQQLSKIGITIVSGMASGIDHWAHTAALREKGGTIGVLGSGIDVTYPSANIKLYEEILSNGSIITEFLPGTGPLRQNFPARNRIISGMSMGVVVIEAPEKSGALITAEFALSQDREVFAVPGNIFNTESTGCNNLIKNGAKPATKVDDILEELGHLYNAGIYDCTKIHKKTSLNHSRLKNEELDLSRDSRIIYDIIGSKPVSIEEIASESKFETSKILQIITELEIKNVIIEKQLNSFVRTY